MAKQEDKILDRIPGLEFIRRVIDERLKRVFKNTGWSLTGNIGSSVFGLIRTILIGRLLGADKFGVLALITAYVTLVNRFLDFRMWETTTKYLSDFWVAGEEEKAVATIKLSYLVDFFLGILAFLVVIGGFPIVSRLVFPEFVPARLVSLFALSMLFATVDNTGRSVLRVFDRFKVLSLWQIAVSFVQLILVALLLLAGWGLDGVLTAYSISAFAGAVGLLYLVRGVIGSVLGARGGSILLLRDRYKELAHFLFHTHMATFWDAIIKNSDVMILGHFLSTTEVGYFKIAKTFVSKLNVITAPLYQTLFAELSKLWAEGDIPAYNRFIKRISIISAALVIPMALVLSVVAPGVVNLTVGEEYLPAVEAIRIMVWGIVIAVTFVWARPTVIAIGKPQIGNLAGGVEAVSYIALSLVLVPLWGHMGTATIFVLMYVLGHLVVIGGYLIHLNSVQESSGSLAGE